MNLMNFGPGVSRYHATTCISALVCYVFSAARLQIRSIDGFYPSTDFSVWRLKRR